MDEVLAEEKGSEFVLIFASIYSDILHINSTYTIFDSQAGNKADLEACRKISFDKANEH